MQDTYCDPASERYHLLTGDFSDATRADLTERTRRAMADRYPLYPHLAA